MLIRSDARSIPLKAGSVQCVVTSPPYWGLRDYHVLGQLGLERTPEEYVDTMVQVFREVWQVLREDGTLWLNIGDVYNGSDIAPGYGLLAKDLKPKDLVGIPWRVAFALQADGWWLRSDIIYSKPNPMPESVTDRPTKSHEYLFLLSKSKRYYYNADAIREPLSENQNGGRQRAEMMGQGTTGTKDYHGGRANRLRAGKGPLSKSHGTHREDSLGRNRRSVWIISTEPYTGSHFATFPRKLVEPCILAGCPLGGVVFDPFVGSGTTVMVARLLGRVGIGADLTYHNLARARIHGPLFSKTVNADARTRND